MPKYRLCRTAEFTEVKQRQYLCPLSRAPNRCLRVKAIMEIRTKSVVFYEEGIRSAREIGETYTISERTVRRWAKAHCEDLERSYDPKRPGRNDPPGNISITGTTNNPAQGEISCVGCPTDQAPVQSFLFLENGLLNPQETRSPYPCESKTSASRQTIPASSC